MRACNDATTNARRYGTKSVGDTTTPRRQRRAIRTKQSTQPTTKGLPTHLERTTWCGLCVLQALGAQGGRAATTTPNSACARSGHILMPESRGKEVRGWVQQIVSETRERIWQKTESESLYSETATQSGQRTDLTSGWQSETMKPHCKQKVLKLQLSSLFRRFFL
jgi:hypothetical protein